MRAILITLLLCSGASAMPVDLAIAIAEAEAEARPAPKPAPKAAPRLPSYPSRSASGSYWHQNGHAPTRQHLASAHGFDINWLNTLNQSQINALHADAHTGDVRSSAVRSGRSSPVRGSTQPQYESDCPNCIHPQRRGLFGWRR